VWNAGKELLLTSVEVHFTVRVSDVTEGTNRWEIWTATGSMIWHTISSPICHAIRYDLE
jgi:hypothetical protein